MKSIQIKNVPVETHSLLRSRAARAGQSLQEYLLAWLIEGARRPILSDVLERVERRSGSKMTPESIVESLRLDRDSH